MIKFFEEYMKIKRFKEDSTNEAKKIKKYKKVEIVDPNDSTKKKVIKIYSKDSFEEVKKLDNVLYDNPGKRMTVKRELF